MHEPRRFRTAPEIPDEGQPLVLHRKMFVWLLLSQPIVWLVIVSIPFIPAVNPVGEAWGLVQCLLPFFLVGLIGVIRGAWRIAGIWLAADEDGVWVRDRSGKRSDEFAIWVPWNHIESIFAVQANRVGIPRGVGTPWGGWTIVVRVRDLPATLRPSRGRDFDRSTFVVSTWLSNYPASVAIAILSRLAAGRAPVG